MKKVRMMEVAGLIGPMVSLPLAQSACGIEANSLGTDTAANVPGKDMVPGATYGAASWESDFMRLWSLMTPDEHMGEINIYCESKTYRAQRYQQMARTKKGADKVLAKPRPDACSDLKWSAL